MVKSKRDKKVSLTKTNKKGLEQKQHVIEDIQSCAEKYANVFMFSVENMRNNKLKEIRTEWKDSRFVFGKNSVMKLGLEKTEIDEALTSRLEGQMGLLFTPHTKETVLDWFKNYSAEEFARGGFRATQTVTLPEGPLVDFSHAIEPHLRKLGMPTKLERGIVTLIGNYTVCEKGNVLTPEQAKILKLVGRPMANFKILIECCFTKEDGFEVIKKNKAVKGSKKIPMKAKDKKKLTKNTKKSKKNDSDDDTAMMEIVEGSDSGDDDNEMDDSD